jgi:hypothetical protein
MPRIKELEDILKLVDEMPEEDQLHIVRWLSSEVQAYEDRVSLGMDIIDYADLCIERMRKRKPPLRGG